MGDQVQATLDRMVPALRDLLDRGIFTEVGAIQESRISFFLILCSLIMYTLCE